MPSHLILFQWDGDHMVPQPRFRKACNERFTVGEVYRMDVSEERSHRSHRFYFAAVQEAWANLPEHLAERFPSPDHLRKWALCRTGFCDSRMIVATNEDEAQYIGATLRQFDPFAVVIVQANVVTGFRAKSQNLKSMDKAEFARSKDAVLNKLSEMLGVEVADLKERARVNA